MQDASRYISFLENFKVFSQNHSQQRIEASKAAFGKVLGGVEMAMRIDREQERLHTPDYNIFLVINRLISDETRLHSPFLKDLLDIQGAHKQGELFLRRFLVELDRKDFLPQTLHKWAFSAQLEAHTGNGKIDILLAYNDGHAQFGIAIEVKVYAQDQPEQLKRYRDYLAARFGENYLLLYLAPWDKQPSEESLSTTDQGDLKAENKLRIISYHTTIANWLQESSKQVSSAILEKSIQDYLTILHHL